jgi:type IV pilus assembly protein PilE
MMFRNTQGGVTLIELMTVIVVLTILVSVAVPSYRNYLIRAQRTEAKTALLNVRAAQEKFYLQRNKYTNKLTDPPASDGLGMLATTDGGLYDITITLANVDQGYTVTATARDDKGQKDDTKCKTLTLNDAGVKGATGGGGTDYCWR